MANTLAPPPDPKSARFKGWLRDLWRALGERTVGQSEGLIVILGADSELDVSDINIEDVLTTADVSGTANQITVTPGTGTIVISFANPTRLASAANIALGNYTEFEADGTMKMAGDATVWEDKNIDAQTLALSAAVKPGSDSFRDGTGTDTGIETLAFGNSEEVSGALEIPHDYKEGTDIVFHVHWQPIAAIGGASDAASWELDWTIGEEGEAPAAVTNDAAVVAVTDRYYFYRTNIATIDGTDIKIGQQLIFTLRRGGAGPDEYAGDLLVATVGIHYQKDTVGSRQITTK